MIGGIWVQLVLTHINAVNVVLSSVAKEGRHLMAVLVVGIIIGLCYKAVEAPSALRHLHSWRRNPSNFKENVMLFLRANIIQGGREKDKTEQL